MKDAWWAIRHNRRVMLLTLIALILLTVLIGLYAVLRFYGVGIPKANTETSSSGSQLNINTVNVPATGQRRIDGVEVAWADANYLPVAVMIENLASIRPQAGLSQANLVYEALAEGGITRFMAVYAHHEVIDKIGPIRSARHYFVDWAEEYGGVYSYVGGSPQALGITNSSEYLSDLNQFYNSAYYYRADDSSAPHNLFSNSELFSYALRDLGLMTRSGDYAVYQFKTNADKADRPDSTAPVTIDYSTDEYVVEWRYDRDSNSYLRWNGGKEHRDVNNNEQLQARNIIVQKVPTTLLEADSGRLDLETLGEGEAIVFQDGTAYVGRWKKTERGQRTQFTNPAGQPFAFNPGVTWIEVVSPETTITY